MITFRIERIKKRGSRIEATRSCLYVSEVKIIWVRKRVKNRVRHPCKSTVTFLGSVLNRTKWLMSSIMSNVLNGIDVSTLAHDVSTLSGGWIKG